MKYYSTRDKAVRMESADAIKMGLSRDGGLLTPEAIPQIDEAFLTELVSARYQERAAKVTSNESPRLGTSRRTSRPASAAEVSAIIAASPGTK